MHNLKTIVNNFSALTVHDILAKRQPYAEDLRRTLQGARPLEQMYIEVKQLLKIRQEVEQILCEEVVVAKM